MSSSSLGTGLQSAEWVPTSVAASLRGDFGQVSQVYDCCSVPAQLHGGTDCTIAPQCYCAVVIRYCTVLMSY